MDELEPLRPGAGGPLADLVREDLELQGVEELSRRVEILSEEIVRTRTAIARKSAGRAAADAFFSLPSKG